MESEDFQILILKFIDSHFKSLYTKLEMGYFYVRK